MLPIVRPRPPRAAELLALAAWISLLLPASVWLAAVISDALPHSKKCVNDPATNFGKGDVFRGQGADGSRFTLEVLSPGYAVLTWEGTLGTTVGGMLFDHHNHHLEMRDDFALESTMLVGGEPVSLEGRCTDVTFALDRNPAGVFTGRWTSVACDRNEEVVFAGPLPSLREELDDAGDEFPPALRAVAWTDLSRYRDPFADATTPLEKKTFARRAWRFPPAPKPVEDHTNVIRSFLRAPGTP